MCLIDGEGVMSVGAAVKASGWSVVPVNQEGDVRTSCMSKVTCKRRVSVRYIRCVNWLSSARGLQRVTRMDQTAVVRVSKGCVVCIKWMCQTFLKTVWNVSYFCVI